MNWNISSTTPAVASSQRLAAFPGLRHGVTVRTDVARDRNYSFATAAIPSAVVEARSDVCSVLGFPLDALVIPQQVHGAGVAAVTRADRGRGACTPADAIPNCDALMTQETGVLLGITVADCLPVFIVDPVRRVSGVAHSGWRGTAARIVVRLVAAMGRTYGTLPEECIVSIGPGIGPEAYEVDAAVHGGFLPDDRSAPGAFSAGRPGHWQLDLTAAVTAQLRSCGVDRANIEPCPWRTNRDTDLFYSHRGLPGCPRMGAFIGWREAGE